MTDFLLDFFGFTEPYMRHDLLIRSAAWGLAVLGLAIAVGFVWALYELIFNN